MLFDTAVLLPLPIIAIVGSAIFGLVLIYLIGFKTFFPSSPSLKSSSPSKKSDSKHQKTKLNDNETKEKTSNKKQQSEKTVNKKSVPKQKVIESTDSDAEEDEPAQKSKTKKGSPIQKQQQNTSKSSTSRDVATTNQSKQQSSSKNKVDDKKQQQVVKNDSQQQKQSSEKRTTGKETVSNKQSLLEKPSKEHSSKHQQYEENENDENDDDLFVTKGAKNKTKSPTVSSIPEKNKNIGKEQQQNREKTSTKSDVQANKNVDSNKKQQPVAAKQVESKSKEVQPIREQQQTETKPKKEKRTAYVEGVEGHNDTGDHEDDGQWLTQGASKQVSNRNRKTKSDQSTEQQKKGSGSKIPLKLNNDMNSKTSPIHNVNNTNNSFGNKNWQRDTTKSETNSSTMASNSQFQQQRLQEPIEICQILPVSTDLYTANDDWWKSQKTHTTASNNKPFNVHDIGDWPEYVEEEFKIHVKKILPHSLQTTTADKRNQQKQAHDADMDDLDDLRGDVDSDTLDNGTGEDETQPSLKRTEIVGENGEEESGEQSDDEEEEEEEEEDKEDEVESDEIVNHDLIEDEDDMEHSAVESTDIATDKDVKMKPTKNDGKQTTADWHENSTTTKTQSTSSSQKAKKPRGVL